MSNLGLASQALFDAGCELRKLERAEEEIFAELWEYNLERCNPPYSEVDIRKIAQACAEFDPRRATNKIYAIEDGCLSKDGKQLCNFDLWIKTQRTYDDGQSRHNVFVMEGRFANGPKIPEFEVTFDEFQNNDFIKHLGYKAIVYVQYMNYQHLKVAIQTLSFDVKEEVVFSHTGFREIDGEPKFLHAGGALGANGNDHTIIVDAASAQLQNICLEVPQSADELRKFCLEVLHFLKIGPPHVMFALLALVFRAPTASILRIAQILFITGPSGVFKTVLLGLMMSFYGRRFNHLNIPGNFESTANAIERMGYQAKDIFMGLDDFAPDGGLYEVQAKGKMFQRIVRGAGNGESGRNRMNADGSLRAVNHFRGALGATGEDVPRNFSTRARMGILALGKDDITSEDVSRFQEYAAQGHFVQVMSGFISWLCPQIKSLQNSLPQKLSTFRNQCRTSSAHRRTPDTVASLAIGYELFLEFVFSTGAITQKEKESLWGEGWLALGQMAEMQQQYLVSEDPALNFIEYIKASLLSGKAHLSNYDDSKLPPAQTDLWGWFFDSSSGEYKAKGTRIGWLDPIKNEVLLLPDAAYASAQEMARSQGGSINISKDIMVKRLAEKNMTLKSDSEGKNLLKRTPDGENRKRLLIFPDPNLFLVADIRNYEPSPKRSDEAPIECSHAH